MNLIKWLLLPCGAFFISNACAFNFDLDIAAADPRDFCYIKEEAKSGLTHSQTMLGIMYAYGIGTETDLECAANWWTKAARHGDPEAQYNLGNAYATGLGVPKDYVRACKWFRAAATQGYMSAQTSLGQCYELGLGGLKKSRKEAIKWYCSAAAQGDVAGEDALNRLCANDN